MAGPLDRPIFAGGEGLRHEIAWPRGGGERTDRRDPATEAARLRQQLVRLREQVDRIPPERRGRRVVFRATLYPEYLAGSHFPTPLLRETGIEVVGSAPSRPATPAVKEKEAEDEASGSDAQAKTLYLAATDQGLDRLATVLEGPESVVRPKAWLDVRKFSEMRLAHTDDVLRVPADSDARVLRAWEAVLHPQGTFAGAADVAQDMADVLGKWVALVRALGGESAVRDDLRIVVEGVCYVPVVLSLEAARDLLDFNPLRILRPLPSLQPVGIDARPAYTILRPFHRAAPTRPASEVRVAVFDGGLSPNCPFAGPFTRVFDLTPMPAADHWKAHGSMVTNAVLYGTLDVAVPLGTPVCYVDHHRVLPAEPDAGAPLGDLDMMCVLRQIVGALDQRDYAVVNLSLGPPSSVDPDDPPHAWTVQLDRIARERSVTFVVAAGNNGGADESRGANRIQVPADMANGISVGSCPGRVNGPARRAGYSGVGPGRHGAWVRPLGVAFGGSLAGDPFLGIGPRGEFLADEGTSYPVGLVSHSLAALVAVLGRVRSTPETLRAFATHFCRRPPRSDQVHQVGFGRFAESYLPLLDCAPNEATVLYEDAVTRGETFALPLPVPRGLPADVRVDIRFTLCYTPPVDPADVAGYTRAGFELRVRPHSRRFQFWDRETHERLGVRDVWREEDVPEVVNGRPARIGRRPLALSFSGQPGTEQRLRQEGKWDTTISKRFSRDAADLYEPTLELAHLARFRGRLIPREKRSPLRYTLLVTVRTPPGVPLYPLVEAQFPLVPIRTDLPLEIS